jgi:hypothetical protein
MEGGSFERFDNRAFKYLNELETWFLSLNINGKTFKHLQEF